MTLTETVAENAEAVVEKVEDALGVKGTNGKPQLQSLPLFQVFLGWYEGNG